MKTDARTQYTRKVIRECFLELLKKTPLNRITVKEICERAQINRSTFYRYYADPFDLMEQLEIELLHSFEKYLGDMSVHGPEYAVEAMLEAVKDNTELYLLLVSENADHQYIGKIVSGSYAHFKSGFARRYPSLSPTQQRWVYYFIAQGCISVVLDWIAGGMQESVKEVARFTIQLDEALLLNFSPPSGEA